MGSSHGLANRNLQFMLSKNRIKYIQSLHQKKYRKNYQQFIAEGTKIVAEALQQRKYKVDTVYALEEWINNEVFLDRDIRYQQVSSKDLKRISTLRTPNQVLAVLRMPEDVAVANSPEDDLHLVLEDIQDPGNLGTIIRIADWFGICQIYCSTTCVEYTNPKVIQSSMGSFLRVGLQYTDLIDLLKKHKTVPRYGAVLQGQNIYENSLEPKGFLVIGNESKGLSDELAGVLSNRISIPQYGRAASLNASVATGILCAYFRTTRS